MVISTDNSREGQGLIRCFRRMRTPAPAAAPAVEWETLDAMSVDTIFTLNSHPTYRLARREVLALRLRFHRGKSFT